MFYKNYTSHLTPENVEFLVGNLNLKTNNYHFRRLIDDVNEQWIWTNYLIETIKYCLINRPNIDYLIKQWGPPSPPPSTDFYQNK
ncbi:hypothetical protein Mgra_00002859 [Meloidogyne graminicola]|uniref:Uncharacterized protein n=1 Tax=Meloidogyne graminicola TaxID=189291 RepID=A0A8S9ZXC7_9BILA|nr:hypothetical protein Mgra_00002859 [Meloidogyne graminicola]